MSELKETSLSGSDELKPKIQQEEPKDDSLSTENEIEAARFDLQSLMTRAHAYCKSSGVASGNSLLPNGAPRRNSYSTTKRSGRRKSSSSQLGLGLP